MLFSFVTGGFRRSSCKNWKPRNTGPARLVGAVDSVKAISRLEVIYMLEWRACIFQGRLWGIAQAPLLTFALLNR